MRTCWCLSAHLFANVVFLSRLYSQQARQGNACINRPCLRNHVSHTLGHYSPNWDYHDTARKPLRFVWCLFQILLCLQTPRCSDSLRICGGGRNFLLQSVASLAVMSYIKAQLILAPLCKSPKGALVCDGCSCPGFCRVLVSGSRLESGRQRRSWQRWLSRAGSQHPLEPTGALAPLPTGSGAALPGRNTPTAGTGQKNPLFLMTAINRVWFSMLMIGRWRGGSGKAE